MNRSEQHPEAEAVDFDFDDDFSGHGAEYERSWGRLDVRRGIEDYFERKKMSQLDDWFDDM